jgi:hypothetical protein
VAVGAALAIAAGLVLAQRKMNLRFEVPVSPLKTPMEVGHADRGGHLFMSRGCAECHGRDVSGRTFVEDAGLRLRAPNITPSGAVFRFDEADWVRAIRHGIGPSTSLLPRRSQT